MTAPISINYIELPAQNFDAVQAFYEQAFGWTFIDYGDQYRAFNDGRLNGGFYQSTQHSSTDNGAALVVLHSDKLSTTRDAVIKAGGEIRVDIFTFPGGKRFQFSDPHGNELAVWSEG